MTQNIIPFEALALTGARASFVSLKKVAVLTDYTPQRRVLTIAGRNRISRAQKSRWLRFRLQSDR